MGYALRKNPAVDPLLLRRRPQLAVVSGSSVAPGAGALTYAGSAPSLEMATSVAPGAGALTYTGLAPTLNVNSQVDPGVGALTYTGFAPSLSGDSSISPGLGALNYGGFAPALNSFTSVSPGAGSLTYTGYAPVIGSLVGPGVGTLNYTGFAPALFGLPLEIGLIPVVNNLEQLRTHANRILARLSNLRPSYGPALPAINDDLDGRLFVLTTTQTLYQQQYGVWVAVDMVP